MYHYTTRPNLRSHVAYDLYMATDTPGIHRSVGRLAFLALPYDWSAGRDAYCLGAVCSSMPDDQDTPASLEASVGVV